MSIKVYDSRSLMGPIEEMKNALSGPMRGVHEAARPETNLAGPAESRFEDALKETIARVNSTQNDADASVARLAAGQEPNIHRTIIKLEEAEISLKLAMRMRSKAMEAYQEIMRMQV